MNNAVTVVKDSSAKISEYYVKHIDHYNVVAITCIILGFGYALARDLIEAGYNLEYDVETKRLIITKPQVQ